VPIDCSHIRLINQTAVYIPQELPDATLAEIFQPGAGRTSVIERHTRRQLHQLIETRALGLDGFRTDSHPICEPSIACIRCLIGSSFAGRGPEHEYFSAIHVLWRKNRIINWLNPIAVAANPSLRGIDLLRGKSAHRALCNARLFGNADYHIAAIEVLQVVGEGTEGLENLGSRIVLVPGFFEFQTRGFYGLSRQKLLDSDWGGCCS